jgi:hypothetical protein
MAHVAVWAPRASRGTRLLLAAIAWSAIGVGLLAAGLHWLLGAPRALWICGLPVALALGWVKGQFVIGSRVRENARRIVEGPGHRCIAGFFSWSGWAIGFIMMVGGTALRRSAIPRPWLGLIYAAIGAALLTASQAGWTGWLRHRRMPEEGPAI